MFSGSRWGAWTRWTRHPLAQAALPALLAAWLLHLALPGASPGRLPASADPGAELRTVPVDVVLAGHSIAGWREAEVRRLLERWADEVRQEPVAATLDPASHGRVPELNGLRVDVEATLERVRRAAPGERVPLVLRETPAAVTLGALPLAPVYRGNPEKHAVAFAINVGWGERFVPQMLRTLAQDGVKATFFLVGEWVEQHPAEALAIAGAGHEIANHGYSAVDFDRLSPERADEQLRRAEEAIRAVTGRRTTLFSPHKGAFSPQLLRVAAVRGYQTVLWSVDTVDWRQPGAERILERVLAEARNGSIVLMHPTAQTAEALEAMIQGLRRKGLRIVTVGTLLSPSPLARD